MVSPALQSALWGFIGAIWYAAPRLSACVFADGRHGGTSRCILDFVIALATGSSAAAVFGASVQSVSGLQHYDAPICAVIGLVANRTMPQVTDALGALLVNLLSGDFLKLPRKGGSGEP